MDDVIIKWVPAGTEKDHDGWRVIGKPKQDKNGQLLVPLARDDGNVYVQFDDDPTMFGVTYEVDMDALKQMTDTALWMKHGMNNKLPQYHAFKNTNIDKEEDFVADVIGRSLIDPLSQDDWESDDHPGFKRAIEELKKLSDDERRRLYYGEFIDDDDNEEVSSETMDEKRKKAHEYIERKIQDIPLHNDPFSAVPLIWQRFIEIDIADNGGWHFKPKASAQLTEEDIEELLNRLDAEARHWQIPEDDEGNSNE